MKKIPTLYKRTPRSTLVTRELNVVLPDNAVATLKWDGSAVMYDGHDWWKRREVKPGQPIPDQYDEVDLDPHTGKRQGWVPITDGPEDKWFRVAINSLDGDGPVDVTDAGTFEAVGPHFQGNPHDLDIDTLRAHGKDPATCSRLEDCTHEGIVWWADGEPVAKLRRRDLGLPWPIPQERT